MLFRFKCVKYFGDNIFKKVEMYKRVLYSLFAFPALDRSSQDWNAGRSNVGRV